MISEGPRASRGNQLSAYQAQKILAYATPLVRQGGDIILLAECADGHGSYTL